MYKIHKLQNKGFLVILVLLSTIILPAQNQQPNNHNEQVTIVSSYDPSINQAFKVNTSPTEIQFNIDKPTYSFETLNIELPTQITLKPIKPVVINADKRTKMFDNSVKFGVGSLISPLLDFFHSSGQKNDYRFDAHFYHLSSFKNIADYSPSPQSNTQLDVNYSKYFGYHIADVGFEYNLKTNRYYGFKPDDFATTINDDRLKQMYNLAKVNVGLSSNYKNNKKLNHKIDLVSYYYFDKYSTSELFTNVNFDAHKNFEVSDMLNYQELGLSGKFTYYNNSDSLTSSNDMLFAATPYFNANYGMINFHIGLNFNVLSTDETKFYFYPIIDVNVNLIPKMLTVFAGLDGNVEKQSYYKLSNLNPWVSSTINTNWDNTFKAFAGIRGNVANKINYSAQVSWQKFNNMFFFVNYPDATSINYLISEPFNKFEALYDKGSVFSVSAQLTYAASEKLDVNFSAQFNSYSLDSLESAYHKPSSKIKLGVSFKATSKIRVWSDVFYYGKRTALDLSVLPSKEIDLDGFIDLNAGVDYTLTKQFTAFLSLTNILNKDYQRYYNYPVNGIQVMGGIMYKF